MARSRTSEEFLNLDYEAISLFIEDVLFIYFKLVYN